MPAAPYARIGGPAAARYEDYSETIRLGRVVNIHQQRGSRIHAVDHVPFDLHLCKRDQSKAGTLQEERELLESSRDLGEAFTVGIACGSWFHRTRCRTRVGNRRCACSLRRD
jgi:hypothetical protein